MVGNGKSGSIKCVRGHNKVFGNILLQSGCVICVRRSTCTCVCLTACDCNMFHSACTVLFPYSLISLTKF